MCMRFLDECPWERLRSLRQACPNICFQMLIRGANAVGYTSYPDNVVEEYIRLEALNGMDIFRIFDCFNIVESMVRCFPFCSMCVFLSFVRLQIVSINAVLNANKVAEVCICYTGNVLTSKIYNLEYYQSLAAEIKATGAHILGIKDMAGLLRPFEAAPLMAAIKKAVGEDFPVHFHTHATSSCSLATCMEMYYSRHAFHIPLDQLYPCRARCGCDIIDFATASMADGTSQPSLNGRLDDHAFLCQLSFADFITGFVAMMEGSVKSTGLSYLALEPYDFYWGRIRDLYSPFESGMKSGTGFAKALFKHSARN